jgi:hypothetical protein
MAENRPEPRSFAGTALVDDALFAVANAFVLPGHLNVYYLTIVWAFVLADNSIWAHVVNADRDVAERAALRVDRERRRAKPACEESHVIDG